MCALRHFNIALAPVSDIPSLILISVKWHLAITKNYQSTHSNRLVSSEARWWNPECVNSIKVGRWEHSFTVLINH